MEHICYNCFSDSLDENGVCTQCGFDGAKNREKYPLALPLGSILFGRYIIGRVLGQGGFGITYLAQDYQTKGRVAIKEFFPETMAMRTEKYTVTPYSGEKGENFAYGLTKFLDEAKTMAEFIGHPNITRVDSYFEENGTGYFVMEYLEGGSFQEYIKSRGGQLSWEETMSVALPVMNALEAVHAKGIIHRDVAPDNIYLTKDGGVKLLDFGAARYSLGNVSHSLDVILKPGFAPKEQYIRRGKQGPFTDVYALGATIYYAITGTKPDESVERADEDNMPMPTTLGAKITDAQEAALLKALAVQSADRYQSIAEFRTAITTAKPKTEPPEPELTKDEAKQSDTTHQEKRPKDKSVKKKPKTLRIVLSTLLLLLLGFGVLFCLGHYTYYENDTGITVTGYKNIFELDVREYIPGKLTIPKKINGKPVTGIHDAFRWCDRLTGVSIPDSVTSIKDFAFYGCTSLTTVSIPDSVTFIGKKAFYACKGLSTVSIPDSVTEIGDHAFDGCTSLSIVSIPRNCELGKNAFPEGCTVTRR